MFKESLKERAESAQRLYERVSELYRDGESDPMTDRFKSTDAAYDIAITSYRSTATPAAILGLLEELSAATAENARLRTELAVAIDASPTKKEITDG